MDWECVFDEKKTSNKFWNGLIVFFLKKKNFGKKNTFWEKRAKLLHISRGISVRNLVLVWSPNKIFFLVMERS